MLASGADEAREKATTRWPYLIITTPAEWDEVHPSDRLKAMYADREIFPVKYLGFASALENGRLWQKGFSHEEEGVDCFGRVDVFTAFRVPLGDYSRKNGSA